VLAALAACRTARMGGHLHRCNACGGETILYNSCGDRHCPKCQGAERAAWLDERAQELLPVQYFHVVFSIPHELTPLAAAHPARLYTLLFRAVRETLLQIAATPRHLGAHIGGLMVLHTWGQTLELHPHVHVIVPGGGLSPDGTRWISCKPGFFLPVRVLSRLLRGKLLAFLRQAYDRGELTWKGDLAGLSDPRQFNRFLTTLYQKEWVVYAKPPFGGAEQALKYLARYTYRVAISNDRIESLVDGQVTFRYKAYAHGHRWRRMTLTAHEFLRRFMQHVLPRGFVRIRSFGFLAHCVREEQLARCRQLLGAAGCADPVASGAPASPAMTQDDSLRCPYCRQGLLELVWRTLRPRVPELLARTWHPSLFDSS
jgi:hypothetical protein